jgi:single-strand DNA-binding protein
MNEYILIGRVTQKPKLSKTKLEGIAVANLNIAVSKRIKQQDGSYKEQTDFIESNCWRNLAEYVANYVNIGDMVLVRGRIRITKDFDTERMTNIYTTVLDCNSVKVLARNKKNIDEIQKEKDDKLIADYKATQEKQNNQNNEVNQPKQVTFKESVKTDDIELSETDLPF